MGHGLDSGLEYLQMVPEGQESLEYEAFGEAICIAKDQAEKKEIYERYICGKPEGRKCGPEISRPRLLVLRSTRTGHALRRTSRCGESIKFPEPVVLCALSRRPSRTRKNGYRLTGLSDEDPTFRIKSRPETMETIISGMGELHLDIIVDRMREVEEWSQHRPAAR